MIEVRLSCEESDLPALRSLVMEWLFPKVKESKTVPAGAVVLEVGSEQYEKAEVLVAPPAKKPEKVTSQLRLSYTDPEPILPLGDHPVNFMEVPINPKEPEPPESGKNKYGRWDQDITPEIDAEIDRLNIEGSTTREISGKFAAQMDADAARRREMVRQTHPLLWKYEEARRA